MNRSWRFSFLLLLGSCLPGQASSTEMPPLPDDEARFVRWTRFLEESPLADPDKSTRTWLLRWASDSKDVTILACDPLGLTDKPQPPYASLLFMQTLFGNATFQIENPAQKTALQTTQMAGVASALKAYASLVRQKPEARTARLDEMVKQQEAGTLGATLAPAIASKCVAPSGQ